MMNEDVKGTGLFDREALLATKVRYLTPENADFEDAGGALRFIDKETGESQRVLLHLLFPFTTRRKLVSVLNTLQEEIGMIEDIDLFSGDTLAAVENEIRRKYFIRKIAKILMVKDRNGTTAWKIEDDEGNVAEFSLKDTYGSMFRVSDVRVLITDSDGSRYEIEDTEKLDKESRRKIELYL